MAVKKLEVKPLGAVVKLEQDNAELWYQNMILESKVDSEVAKLYYEIMIGGM